MKGHASVSHRETERNCSSGPIPPPPGLNGKARKVRTGHVEVSCAARGSARWSSRRRPGRRKGVPLNHVHPVAKPLG